MNHTHPLQDELVGALIGLARAISGNEDLVTDDTDRVVLESLALTHPKDSIDPQLLSQQIQQISEEKKRIVPDCAVCCNPCGRTENYDMEHLWNAPEGIRTLKMQILWVLCDMAAHIQDEVVSNSSIKELTTLFYKALRALGMDHWGEQQLRSLLLEINELTPT